MRHTDNKRCLFFIPLPSFQWFVLYAQIIGKDIKKLNIWRHRDQGFAKYGPWTRSSLLWVLGNKILLEHSSLVYILPVVAFMWQCQSWVAVTEFAWPTKAKILNTRPLIEKVCWTLIDKWLTLFFSFFFSFSFPFSFLFLFFSFFTFGRE